MMKVACGNQYVWIPVTHVNGEKINTINDNNGNGYTIELARYIFNSDGTILKKILDGTDIDSGYKEETEEEHKISEYKNTIAKDINKFKESIKKNGGYYIARYEAGDLSTTSNRTSSFSQTVIPTFKENITVYNYITQPNAALLIRNLYSNQSENYESDLVNSYAWDTAILFIQTFSEYETYSWQGNFQTTLAKTGKSAYGTKKDVGCNIYDMAGNVSEWTTESYSNIDRACVIRGSYYQSGVNNYMVMFTKSHYNYNLTTSAGVIGFRRNFIYIVMNF